MFPAIIKCSSCASDLRPTWFIRWRLRQEWKTTFSWWWTPAPANPMTMSLWSQRQRSLASVNDPVMMTMASSSFRRSAWKDYSKVYWKLTADLSFQKTTCAFWKKKQSASWMSQRKSHVPYFFKVNPVSHQNRSSLLCLAHVFWFLWKDAHRSGVGWSTSSYWWSVQKILEQVEQAPAVDLPWGSGRLWLD